MEKKLRVAIGSFWHETSSFSSEYTSLEEFKTWVLDEKEQVLEGSRGVRTCSGNIGGYVDYVEEKGWDVVPLIAAGAIPSGPIRKEAYEYIKNVMINNLKGQELDGVLLHLHGAAVVEGLDDCEGDLLTAVREEVGEETPVLVVFDPHGNISDLSVEKADAIFAYNTQPHEDSYEREQEACQLLEQIVSGRVKTTCVRMQPPILLPALRTETESGPMKKLMDRAYKWEENENVINVSPFAGFYGSDKKEAGPSFIVVTNNDTELAEKIARDMVEFMWEIKEEFFIEPTPLEEAIEKAMSEGGLWAFIDECDDPCGAGPGDGTYILQAVLDAKVPSGGVSAIHDPKVVERAYQAGVGGVVTGKLGAWRDNLHGEPVDLNAKVVKLTDEKLPYAYYGGDPQDVGRIAVIDQNGILIVVTELKADTENLNVFEILGIDVRDLNIIILKGLGHAYKKAFKDLPKGYITPESIGITNPDVRKIGEFKNIRRPVYPLDKNVALRYK
ncbi:M81 family metallopeptidase [Siminovitchia sediminis]|uniref:M81 family metallopeptidase n=1 Tax=Siminovitchia sediminis TaxID=1274353 RepID=A0ABW4KPS9_9BACI